jgi:hypothetical protein
VPRPRDRGRKAAAEEEQPAAEAVAKEKSPEQLLEEKLELDRFVAELRRKYH